jgi:carbamoyl-phosphate synthase large subunit
MSRARISVLITAVGGDLGQALVKALHVGAPSFEISGCDLDASGVGQAFVPSFYTVPAASDAAAYVDAIDDLCRRHEIDAIIPASEAEIAVLAQVGRRLESGAGVVCQPWPWLRVFGDKLTCMQALEKLLRLAAFADSSDKQSVTELVQRVGFPLMVKARHSSGSRGVVTVRTPDELATSIAETPPSVVQEFIDDNEGEFSVGVFATDTFTEVLAFRRELRHGGCSWFAETSQDEAVIDYALEFAKVSALKGSANIQLRKSSSGVRLLEVNPRFSSLVAARALCGFRDAEWSTLAALGRPVPAPPQTYGTLRFRRFFHEVVDFGSGYYAVNNWTPNSLKLEDGKQLQKSKSVQASEPRRIG